MVDRQASKIENLITLAVLHYSAIQVCTLIKSVSLSRPC